MFACSARRSRKVLGGGMRQVGFLAAAGIYALDNIVPTLSNDHTKIRRIAEALHALNSPILRIDIEHVQTNILMLHLTNDKMNSSDFSKRLLVIDDAEITAGATDSNGQGICLKLSARDWSFARVVAYHQITDEMVELAIKKLTYVIKEFEAKILN
jgi:threonine aldolase